MKLCQTQEKFKDKKIMNYTFNNFVITFEVYIFFLVLEKWTLSSANIGFTLELAHEVGIVGIVEIVGISLFPTVYKTFNVEALEETIQPSVKSTVKINSDFLSVFSILEKLNLSSNADSSTDTETDKN